MKQIHPREGARRQHRTISLFAAIQCWTRQLDGIVIEREDLERLIGIRKFDFARINWLVEDFKPFFPYVQKPRFFLKGIGSFWVSRKEFSEYLPKTGDARQMLAKISAQAPKFGIFKLWEELDFARLQKFEVLEPFLSDLGDSNADERLLTSFLSLLAQGQVSVDSIPPLSVNYILKKD